MKYECPIYDTSCPYLKKDGECTIENPKEECDEYWWYNQDEEN